MINKLIFLLYFWRAHASPTQDSLQPLSFQKARLGDSVTFECYIPKVNVNYMTWYKLDSVMGLQFVTKLSIYDNEVHFFNGFRKRGLIVWRDTDTFHLNISEVNNEDIGTYYCGKIFMNQMQVVSGTILILTGLSPNIQAVVQQSVSESVQPGDSVILNCTVHTQTCDGNHSVYWFRRSGESLPGIIYTNGGSSDRCAKSREAGSPTPSCVYSLPKKNVTFSDAGTYYCAVASCGEILFGNGTKLDVQGIRYHNDLTPTALVLVATNLLSVIVIVALTCGIYKRNRKQGETNRPPSSSGQPHGEEVNYAAVSFAPRCSSSRKTSRHTAMYSEVRYLQQD